jgi:CHAD domain-containing protein
MKRWKNSLGLRDNLQARTPELVSAWFARGRAALNHDVPWAEMHEFRLRTKRFRYTLELLRPAYGPGLERKLKLLKKLQDYLGEINDAVVTAELLSEIPETEETREELRAKAARLTDKLRAYWTETMDAAGEEQRWIRYLRQYAARCAPPKPRSLPASADTAMALLPPPAIGTSESGRS